MQAQLVWGMVWLGLPLGRSPSWAMGLPVGREGRVRQVLWGRGTRVSVCRGPVGTYLQGLPDDFGAVWSGLHQVLMGTPVSAWRPCTTHLLPSVPSGRFKGGPAEPVETVPD